MMQGYDDVPRGGYGLPPDLRQAKYNQQYYRTMQGPSPWIPATILGVILLITTTPYMRTPDATMAYFRGARISSSSFPSSSVLWLPVLGVIALQFFGGPWYHGYGEGQAYGRQGLRGPGLYGYPSGAYGGVLGAQRASWWPWSSSSSLRNPYHVYNVHQQRGLMAMFMDYGGHWLLILLGVGLFTLVVASSFPATPVSMAPRSWGFFSRLLF